MSFFRVSNGEISDGPVNLPRLWADDDGTQHPVKEMWEKGHKAEVSALGWLQREIVATAHDPLTQIVDGYVNAVVGDKVVSTEIVRSMTAPELAVALKRRMAAAKEECSIRIFAVVDANAQMNLASAAGAGMLTAEQMQTYQSGLQWVADMRSTWTTLAEQGADIYDDASWPPVPAGVVELAESF